MGPSARSYHATVYASREERGYLFGGFTTVAMNDLWQWNGYRWVELTNKVGMPPKRHDHAMVYVETTNSILVMGGVGSGGGSRLVDMWEFDCGTGTWKLIPRSGTQWPKMLARLSAAYDAKRNVVVLYQRDVPTSVAETWEWDVQTRAWSLKNGSQDIGIGKIGMAYYPPLEQVVAFGHDVTDSVTWGWDGTAWIAIEQASPPEPRENTVLVYDEMNRVLVMFGGGTDSTYMGDTWVFDGTTWGSSAAVGPVARNAHAGFYDLTTGETIIHGGAVSVSTLSDETWGFDTVNWVEAGEDDDEVTPWTMYPGTYQLMIEPQEMDVGSGEYVFVMGHDLPGFSEIVSVGDRVFVEQDVDLTGASLVGFSGKFRCPDDLPTGTGWKVAVEVDTGTETLSSSHVYTRGQTFDVSDMKVNVHAINAQCVVRFSLELVAI